MRGVRKFASSRPYSSNDGTTAYRRERLGVSNPPLASASPGRGGRTPPKSRRNEAAAKLLVLYFEDADNNGEVSPQHEHYAQRLGVSRQTIRHTSNRLIDSGALERIGQHRYRVTGEPYTPRPPSPARPPNVVIHQAPSIVPAQGDQTKPCSYRGARAMGIEPVVRLMGPNLVAISLARVPCIDGPAP